MTRTIVGLVLDDADSSVAQGTSGGVVETTERDYVARLHKLRGDLVDAHPPGAVEIDFRNRFIASVYLQLESALSAAR